MVKPSFRIEQFLSTPKADTKKALTYYFEGHSYCKGKYKERK